MFHIEGTASERPGGGMCLVCLGNNREASVAGASECGVLRTQRKGGWGGGRGGFLGFTSPIYKMSRVMVPSQRVVREMKFVHIRLLKECQTNRKL